MTKYTVNIRHYGQRRQQVGKFDRKYKAEEYLLKEVEIQKGYNKTHICIDGVHHLINKGEDTFATTLFTAKFDEEYEKRFQELGAEIN